MYGYGMELALNICIPVALAIALNIIIFSLRWNQRDKADEREKNPLIPPGPVVGSVWLVILGLLGYARYVSRESPVASWALVTIIVVCLGYPLYTLGFKAKAARIANLITLLIAFVVAMLVVRESTRAALCVAPLLLWTSYVNIADAVYCNRMHIL